MKTAVVLIQRDAPNILEWAQWYARLGFNDIFIGCNRCGLPDIPREIGSTCVHAFRFDPAPQRLADQFNLYDLVIERCGADFDWMLFVDDDEYLWLGGSDAKTFFSNHEDDYAVAFNWRFFSAKEDVAEPADSLLKRFTWRQQGFNKHVKIAAHLSKIKDAGLARNAYFLNPHMLGHPA